MPQCAGFSVLPFDLIDKELIDCSVDNYKLVVGDPGSYDGWNRPDEDPDDPNLEQPDAALRSKRWLFDLSGRTVVH